MSLTQFASLNTSLLICPIQQQLYMVVQQQVMWNGTEYPETMPGSRLYMRGREVHFIPKTIGECIGEKLVHPAINHLSSLIFGVPTLISSFSGRVFSFFGSLPLLLPLLEGAHAQELSQSCLSEDPLQFFDDGEEEIGNLSEQQLQKCGSVFSLLSAKSDLTSCFYAAYAACQERNWVLIEQIQPISNSLVNIEGRSLVWEAIHQRDYFLAEELIYKKIALHTKDSAGNTLFHFAARLGRSALVKYLHQFNQIDAVNNDGESPLHKAAEYGHDHVVAYLTDHGASLKVFSKLTLGGIIFERFTPLHLAVIHGQHRVINVMFEKKLLGNLDAQISGIGHILHLAIYFHEHSTLRFLLTKFHTQVKSLINIGNDRGVTPVMLASQMGDWKSLLLLREKRAYFEERDNLGRTAVHWAVLGRQKNSLALLHHYGCDLETSDNEGKAPIQLLKSKAKVADIEIANYLNGLILQKKNPHPPIHRSKSCYPEGVVFKGGGPKGVAYVGAVAALYELQRLNELLRVGGTSAGAITATLLAMGCKADEIEELLNEDLTKFLDHPFTQEAIQERLKTVSVEQVASVMKQLYAYYQNPLGTLARDVPGAVQTIWKTTGACAGETFRERMETLISSKIARVVGGKQEDYAFTTFGELNKLIEQGQPFKHLYVVTTNLATGEIEEISSENPKWANVIISDAIRASMSIPFVFVPHHLHTKDIDGKRKINQSLGLHVDGGLLRNFPIELFDKQKYHPVGVREGASFEMQEEHFINTRTLGLSLFSPDEKQPSLPKTIQTLGDLGWALGEIYADAEKAFQGQVVQNACRTIEINNKGVGLLEFHLSHQKIEALVKSGLESVRQFFSDCPESVVTHLKRDQSIHPQIIEKWSKKLKLLNEINSEAFEWLVISSYFQSDEIPVVWINRWFVQKDLLASSDSILDLGRENNFFPPFNLLKTVQSKALRQNVLYHLIDLGFYQYNENKHTLTLDNDISEIIQAVVLAEKKSVENWIISQFTCLKEEHHQKWVQHCQWISRHIANDAMFKIKC